MTNNLNDIFREFRLVAGCVRLWRQMVGVDKDLETAKKAHELGYPLCLCAYPPKIMLQGKNETEFHCPHCSRIKICK